MLKQTKAKRQYHTLDGKLKKICLNYQMTHLIPTTAVACLVPPK